MPALIIHRALCAHANPCCLQFNLFKDWEQAKKQASRVLGAAQAKAYETMEEVSHLFLHLSAALARRARPVGLLG